MADYAGRNGRGWTIAGAFAAQALIFFGIAALVTGTSSAPVMSASAIPVPAVKPVPSPISLLPVMKGGLQVPGGADGLPFTLTVDGQSGKDIFLDGVPAPLSYTVTPGQDLTITLSVVVQSKVSITDLSLSLEALGQQPQDQVVYEAPAQPLTPGQHTFTVNWAGSASDLQPGTTWSIFMSADSPGVYAYNDGTIATLTVGS